MAVRADTKPIIWYWPKFILLVYDIDNKLDGAL